MSSPKSGSATTPCSHRISHVVAKERQGVVTDLHQARDRPRPDLLLKVLLAQIRRHHHRPLRLIALVDDRVELLEHPVAALLGAEVVDVEEVDLGEALE